ncbi:MAG TPA: ABC transporter permease [Bacillota bacterium]
MGLGDIARRFVRNRLAVVGALFLLVVHGVAVLAPWIIPVDPLAVDPIAALRGPEPGHPLGTDEFGRDVLSRLAYGGRVSLAVGLLSMAIALVFGTAVGAASGFFGGAVEVLLMRFTDAMMAIPPFFLLLATLAVLGGTPAAVIVVIGLTSWMGVARVVRSEYLRWREEAFVESARALGARDARILTRHVLPQALPSVIVSATLGVAFAILTESAVSFLGFGIAPPTPTWGNMLMNAQQYLWTSPMLAVYPGLMILLTVLSYNFVGDGLRDALDPFLRGRFLRGRAGA